MSGPHLCIVEHRHDPDRERRAVDGLYLCAPGRDEDGRRRGCLGHLERLISEMPFRWHELGDVLDAADSSTADGPRVSGSSTEPLPINPAAAAHRGHIVAVMGSWARLISEERGIAAPPYSSVTAVAAFLVTHAEWCAGHEWVTELLAEMRSLNGRAWAIVDPDRRLTTGERCRVVDEETGERCDGAIRMVHGSDDAWGADCTVCGRQEAAPYLHTGHAGRWVTVERVCAYALRAHGVRVAEATVRDWVRRRRIRNRDEHGVTWYDLGSVETYLASRKEIAS